MSKRNQVAIAILKEAARGPKASGNQAGNQPASAAEEQPVFEGEFPNPSIIWPAFPMVATTRNGNA